MDANPHTSSNKSLKTLIGIFLIGGVFAMDLYTPLGIPDGMSYIIVVILTIWTKNNNYTIGVATLSVILTVIGYYLSPHLAKSINDIAVINRSISVLLIIISAFLIIKYKKVEKGMIDQKENVERLSKKLKETNTQLEEQVKVRTQVLQEALNELEYSKQELNTALEHEKELSALKTRIVSMASHEFRTPLATILSSLSLISKYGEMKDTDKQHKHIVRIRSAISHLTDLVEDTLSVSKLEEDEIDFSLNPICIDAFIHPLLDEIGKQTKTGQTINYSHSGNAEVINDKKVLKRIVMNLLSNAIKFSDEGKPIYISTLIHDNFFTLKVEDQGIGIPEKEQKKLFERFFRAENAFNIQGTGLGLCIVAKYVELMNGAILVESKENKGSTFTVKLPIVAQIKTNYAIAS